MKKEVNMIEGPLVGKILIYAIPLIASGLLQQMFNACDSAVVGKFAGTEALAAVGANTSLCSLFINAFIGLSVGTNVLVAHYIGSKRVEKIFDTIETVILFGIIGGIIVMIIGEIYAKQILILMGTPDNILALAALYLRLYLLGLPFLAVFNFGSAVVRSDGNTKRPMVCLFTAGIINVLLNLLLVIVFHLSVAGVAIATAISNVVSCSMILYTLCKYDNYLHLDLKQLKIKKEPLLMVLKYGAPAALQSMVFSISNVSIQSGINTFGSTVMAGSAAAMNFEYLSYQMVNAFNQATVTFVGQNFAAGKHDRCKRIYAISMIECLIGVFGLICIFWFGRTYLIDLFAKKEVIKQYAYIRMKVTILPYFLLCSYEITGSVLRGMGHSLEPALLTVLGCVGFRILWLFTVFKVLKTLQGLLLVYPASWIVTGTMVITCYVIVSRKVFKNDKL